MKKRINNFNVEKFEAEPFDKLRAAVFLKINLEAKRQAKRRIFLYNLGFISLASISIYSAITAGHEILTSEFWSFANLAFTNIREVGIYWQDFLFSLFETFPATAVVGMLLPIVALLVLIHLYYEKDINVLKMHI